MTYVVFALLKELVENTAHHLNVTLKCCVKSPKVYFVRQEFHVLPLTFINKPI